MFWHQKVYSEHLVHYKNDAILQTPEISMHCKNKTKPQNLNRKKNADCTWKVQISTEYNM